MKTQEYIPFIRRAFELAVSAVERGNHPFGAVLVNDGKIVLESENTVITEQDFTRHAELNLVVQASKKFDRAFLETSTLFASTSPCPMCSYAIWSVGVKRIIYGVSYETFANLITFKPKYITCEQIFQQLGSESEIVGGVLEEEGVRVYEHWTK